MREYRPLIELHPLDFYDTILTFLPRCSLQEEYSADLQSILLLSERDSGFPIVQSLCSILWSERSFRDNIAISRKGDFFAAIDSNRAVLHLVTDDARSSAILDIPGASVRPDSWELAFSADGQKFAGLASWKSWDRPNRDVRYSSRLLIWDLHSRTVDLTVDLEGVKPGNALVFLSAFKLAVLYRYKPSIFISVALPGYTECFPAPTEAFQGCLSSALSYNHGSAFVMTDGEDRWLVVFQVGAGWTRHDIGSGRCFAVSRYGTVAAIYSSTYELRIFDWSDPACPLVIRVGSGEQHKDVALSSNGALIAALEEKIIFLYENHWGPRVSTVRDSVPLHRPAKSLRFFWNDQRLAINQGKAISIFDLPTSSFIGQINPPFDIINHHFMSSRALLFEAGDETQMSVVESWEAHLLDYRTEAFEDSPAAGARWCLRSRDRRHFAYIVGAATCHVWDLRTRKMTEVRTAHGNKPVCGALNNDGSMLLLCCAVTHPGPSQGTMTLYSGDKYSTQITLWWYSGRFTCAAMSHSGGLLAVADDSSSVSIVDTSSLKVLRQHSVEASKIVFSDSGHSLALRHTSHYLSSGSWSVIDCESGKFLLADVQGSSPMFSCDDRIFSLFKKDHWSAPERITLYRLPDGDCVWSGSSSDLTLCNQLTRDQLAKRDCLTTYGRCSRSYWFNSDHSTDPCSLCCIPAPSLQRLRISRNGWLTVNLRPESRHSMQPVSSSETLCCLPHNRRPISDKLAVGFEKSILIIGMRGKVTFLDTSNHPMWKSPDSSGQHKTDEDSDSQDPSS